ncbi:MAG: hypothetical protein AB2799_18925 [Candidatus Thiodiazotropha sp.]
MAKKSSISRSVFKRLDDHLKETEQEWQDFKKDFGVSKQTINNWQSRGSLPVDYFFIASRILDVDVSSFFISDPQKKNKPQLPLLCYICQECASKEINTKSLKLGDVKCLLFRVVLLLHGNKHCPYFKDGKCTYYKED